MSEAVVALHGVDRIAAPPNRVFISYSHDDDEHERRILDFSERLRAEGIDAVIDQYTPWPPEGWPRWMERQLNEADFVLLACTPTYHRRVSGDEQPAVGRGVCWEAVLIYNQLYREKVESTRFIPVLFEGSGEENIPGPLAGHAHFRVDDEDGYEELYRRLTNQPRATKGELGQRRILAAMPTLRGKVPQPETMEPPPAAKRVFISYSHADPREENLARCLYTRLVAAGHDVFIDITIKAGTDWAGEISGRISWCDHLVVLLSETSMSSEMVQGEVRAAHYLQKRHTGPKIVPVRVDYAGPLEYELSLYLDRLHYINWTDESNTDAVVEVLTTLLSERAPCTCDEAKDNPQPAGEARAVDNRPRPQWDARSAAVPGGVIQHDDAYYIRRKADENASRVARAGAESLVIKGARQMGKSSLLMHYLVQCQEAGKSVAFVDFSMFSNEDMTGYATFLGNLARAIKHMLQLEDGDPAQVTNQFEMMSFVETYVLAPATTPIVVAFDEVDRVYGRPYQSDFFTMLRFWINASKAAFRPRWRKLQLALVVSTEPALLIAEADRSPFNVGYVQELQPFTRPEFDELCDRHGCQIDRDALWDLVRGHPYLSRLAFYRLVDEGLPFADLLRDAAAERGPFGDHLRALLVKLHENPELLSGMQQIIRMGTAPSDNIFYRLYSAGLVQKENGRINPSNLVYARYFRGI